MKLFKDLGKALGKLGKPVQSLLQRVIAGSSVNKLKNMAQERFLAYLTTTYENEIFGETREIIIRAFDAIEKFIKVFPDAFGDSMLKSIGELEVICVKFLEILQDRIDTMDNDGKITNTELDELVSLIYDEFFQDVKDWFENVKAQWGVDSVKAVIEEVKAEVVEKSDTDIEESIETRFPYIAELRKKYQKSDG